MCIHNEYTEPVETAAQQDLIQKALVFQTTVLKEDSPPSLAPHLDLGMVLLAPSQSDSKSPRDFYKLQLVS